MMENYDDALIQDALNVLRRRMKETGAVLKTPQNVHKYLTLKLAELEHEVFGVLFLDTKNRLIADEIIFRGTTTHTSVYPREVAKECLKHNAISVVIYHNHPSGNTEPSSVDIMVTMGLKKSLALIDVKLDDHFIVAGMATYSFLENGKL